MNVRTIVVVEDDRKTAELLRLYLERDGFRVFVADDGGDGVELAREHRPDLVVLDLMLPTISGLDLCRILRYDAPIPIIMLTAKSTEGDVLYGLELGADDYITKPFSPRELVARVRAVLRRTADLQRNAETTLQFGDLEINLARHEAFVAGRPVQLTPREFRLLETLVSEPGRAFKRLELLELAFGFDYEGLERTVDAHIMNLRRKIEPNTVASNAVTANADTPVIQTIYGVGYKFVAPSEGSQEKSRGRGGV